MVIIGVIIKIEMMIMTEWKILEKMDLDWILKIKIPMAMVGQMDALA